mmetsp:Transcript_24476/g.35093  ORF Transcript_24476/g.35093 Transcript_24476/m.35093 type:complete len:97 (+) Transcript_24476:303-593(+)
MKSHLVINGSKIDEPERRRVNWNDDNANNSDQSSMNILINWVTTEGRYAAVRQWTGFTIQVQDYLTQVTLTRQLPRGASTTMSLHQLCKISETLDP